MLQYGTVEPGTLGVLKELMKIPELNSFYLAGGTALALYFGHRLSIDLDLFSDVDFQDESLVGTLENKYSTFTYNNNHNTVGLFSFINDIKVDFVRYSRYHLINDILTEDGIRLAAIQDIAAMKIAAVLRRGVKKDFWDISELLHHFTINDLITLYNSKYPNQQLLISIPQALTYFSDAEESEEPVSLKGQTWELVKAHINQKVDEYFK